MIHLHPTSTSSRPSAPRPAPLDDGVVLEVGLDDLAVGTTRLAKVDGHRVCVARTERGVFAVDHACPHEGYGLTQGSLDGDLLTCAWHNWKFDVTTGACQLGEEDVTSHEVTVGDDGSIAVRLRRPDPAEQRDRLLASLERGLAKDYVGQIARDVSRLLAIGVSAEEIVSVGVAYGAPRGEYGWGHAIAGLTDCLAMVDLFDGDQRAIPLVQGLSFVAHDERGRVPHQLPAPAPADEVSMAAFLDAVEREELSRAQALVLGAIESGRSAADLHRWFVGAVSAHVLSYGHGAIYTQKAFELLDRIGWEHATTVLGHLVHTVVTSTREDLLPYHVPFARGVAAADLSQVAASADMRPGAGPGELDAVLLEALLGPDRGTAATATVEALGRRSVDEVLDVIVDVTARRLLRYDAAATEADLDDDFGWLDITHGITFAHAGRAALGRLRDDGMLDDADTRLDVVRLVLHCAFLANWTGRHEWHTSVGPTVPTSIDDVLDRTADAEDHGAALALVGDDLQRRSLDDVHTAPIHVVHAVKTSRAAHLEAQRTGDGRVLAAVARYFDDPRQERGVRATIHRSIEFVGGRLQR